MALIGNTNEEKIWNYFIQKDKIGNAYGVAGFMGNIKRESNFNPKNMENSYEAKLGFTDETYVQAVDNNTYHNFQTDRCGFGICQHTSSDRKTNMWIRSKETNKSIGDLEFQLDFIMWEFNNGYKTVLNTLKNATSVKEASDYVCTKYERPANQSTSALKSRSDAGEEIYEKFYKKENVKEENKVGYTNSSLVTYTKISPNRTSPRNHKLDTITIHCIVGQWTAKQGCDYFANASRNASPNYVVGKDGSIGLCVEEKDRSWCTSTAVNDHRAITIEVASDTTHPYAVTDTALNALIILCADICKRNGIKKLVWSTNKNERVNHLNGCNMTVHRDFANKSCPGEYLYSRHGYIADEVNKLLGISTIHTTTTTTRSYLMKGDKGTDVKELQENLNYLGYSCGKADGDFGTKTHNALIDFQEDYQKSHNLTVDGKYGSNSKRVLEEAVAKKKNGATSTAKTYTVVGGDTLSKIGSKTGVNWKTIAQLNGIKSPYTVKIGQVLKLSEGSTTQSKPTTTSSNSVNYTYKGVNYSFVFNPTYYSNKYPDLKKAFGTNATKLFSHFTEHGMKEGRQACEGFNVNVYKNTYVDLQKAFGNDLPKYYEHYCKYGYKEKRKAN